MVVPLPGSGDGGQARREQADAVARPVRRPPELAGSQPGPGPDGCRQMRPGHGSDAEADRRIPSGRPAGP